MRARLDVFQRLALGTVGITYLLISVGAFVRVTGAGLGCPDWPKCFGLWIPPTRVEELPAGYDVTQFVPLLTWIEYLNRLLGALTGLFILGTVVASLVLHRKRPSVWAPSVAALVAVLYAAWLGGRVVAHELAPWIVTAHLVSAIVVVTCLLVAVVNVFYPRAAAPTPERRRLALFSWLTLALTVVQCSVGTQVRGTLEDVARANPLLERGEWLDQLGALDFGHRNLALLVVLATAALFLWTQKHLQSPVLERFALWPLVLSLLQVLIGLGLAYADLPRGLQILHLLVGALSVGALSVLGMAAGRAPAAFVGSDDVSR